MRLPIIDTKNLYSFWRRRTFVSWNRGNILWEMGRHPRLNKCHLSHCVSRGIGPLDFTVANCNF